MVQWLGIHLPVQGTRVRALVREDTTCCGARRATTTEAHGPRARAPQQEKPPQREARALQ